MLQRLTDAGFVKGKTIGIDATTLEGNAALRSIVRRDTGEGYETFLRGLAAASGIATPTRAELARLDRKRPRRGPTTSGRIRRPDAKITEMKDGRTHLAHKAEHPADLGTSVVVGLIVQHANAGDTTTMIETLVTAAEQVEAVLPAGGGIAEVVGDKGYHSNETLVGLADLGLRSYVSEADRGRRCWHGKPAARDAVYGSRRRIRGARGKRLLRQRGERLERPNGPSLRNRRPAPGVSARAHQHPRASSGARVRLQPGLPHATADGRRDAAEPPGPRPRARRGPGPRAEPLLAPRSALPGADWVRAAGPGADSVYGRVHRLGPPALQRSRSATGC